MIEFSTLTRATGKVCIAVHADVPEGGRLEGTAHCSNGQPMPALVLKQTQTDYILVLATLTVQQTVTLTMYDAQGAAVEETSNKVGHIPSALSSKYNTLRKVDNLEDIRHYDESGVLDEAFIRADSVTILENKTEILHVYITAPCEDEHALDVPLDVCVFNRRGRIIPVKKRTVLKDVVEPIVPGSSCLARFIELSLYYEEAPSGLFVWITFQDDTMPAGLLGLEKNQIEELRGANWDLYTRCGFSGRYEEWFKTVHRTPRMVVDAQRTVHFDVEPLFSIIVPLFKTPLNFLHDMVTSVTNQSYSKFELILVNASPEDEQLCQAIQDYAAEDERIRIVPLEENVNIAVNTNAGIKAATGDFLCFLDHDDFIEPDLLFHYVKAINEHPQTDLLYCDEDKFRDGQYMDGFLKPDFDWELLAAINYICHMLVVRASVLEEAGLLQSETSGAQDWDLSYRVAEKAKNICHVRKVLYHWRIHKKSTANDSSAKPWTHTASQKVVQQHYDRIGIPAKVVDGPFTNSHAVQYLLPEDAGLVSIIIPTKDHVDLLDRCLTSIYEKSTYRNFEVVVVENNSTDERTFQYYEQAKERFENLSVVTYEGGFNFSAICNLGAKNAKGDYYLFLNNDTEVITPDWLEQMLGPCQREDVACTGAKLLYPDDTIQHAGVIMPKTPPGHVARCLPRDTLFYLGFIQHAREVSAVTGACQLIKKDDFNAVNGFDEELAVAYNDVDLCLRLREAGRRIVMQPHAERYHYESASRGSEDANSATAARFASEKGMFVLRWNHYISEGDPMYSCNFAVGAEYFDLDWTKKPWGI